jgi:predicted nucleic acid-binding protein
VRNVLLGVGPLVALFAADDRHHKRYDAALRRFAEEGLRLLTAWPSIVEAAYLLEAPQRI